MALGGGMKQVTVPGSDTTTTIYTPPSGFTAIIKSVKFVHGGGSDTDITLEYDNGSVFPIDSSDAFGSADEPAVLTGPFPIGNGESLKAKSSASEVTAIFGVVEIQNS